MDNRPMELATLGGGCFWCLEAVFELLEGVSSVKSGYAGGAPANPTYRQVCTGSTGHAEVVQVAFDPEITSYREVLEVFFSIHDPTTKDRQGADVGTQYRSVIFYHSDQQQRIASEVIKGLESDGIWKAPIVTEVAALPEFYPADASHDQYYRQNANQPYCRVVVEPKVVKFRQKFAHKLRSAPRSR